MAAQAVAQASVQIRVLIAQGAQLPPIQSLDPIIVRQPRPRAAVTSGVTAPVSAGDFRVVLWRRSRAGAAAGTARLWVRDLSGRERELLPGVLVTVAEGVSSSAAAALALRLRSEGAAHAVELTYEVQSRAVLRL